MTTSLDDEVDANFEAFQSMLPDLMAIHHGQYALLRQRRVEGFHQSLRAALEAAAGYPDQLFSIQEVTTGQPTSGCSAMPSIRGSLKYGQPLVPVPIGSVSDPHRAHECMALIDTGCTITGITQTIVEKLGLRHTTRKLVMTPIGESRRKAYPFTVGFLTESEATIGAVRSPFYFPEPVLGADFVETGQFDVLLGMDLLSQGRLVFDRGSFEFSF